MAEQVHACMTQADDADCSLQTAVKSDAAFCMLQPCNTLQNTVLIVIIAETAAT